jgi:hypothetical protein
VHVGDKGNAPVLQNPDYKCRVSITIECAQHKNRTYCARLCPIL